MPVLRKIGVLVLYVITLILQIPLCLLIITVRRWGDLWKNHHRNAIQNADGPNIGLCRLHLMRSDEAGTGERDAWRQTYSRGTESFLSHPF